MFDQSADPPAPDQASAPIGMRELPPQPAKPVMPPYVTGSSDTESEEAPPAPDDSVVARDDHVEGTFTSRGTVRVLGSLKGRIEAVRVRIEDGANVEADVIVDEAIVAGRFTGNLTCRQRLEARASGRISGRVETYRLMLHEGASVEGEMHMLTEEPRDATTTIRGSAPIRGDVRDARSAGPEKPEAVSPGARSSAPKTSGSKPSDAATSEPGDAKPSARVEAVAPKRTPVSETLRAETLRLMPRTSRPAPSSGTNGARDRSGTTSGF